LTDTDEIQYQSIETQNGIRLAQYRSFSEAEGADGVDSFEVGYGGWLDSSAFAIEGAYDERSEDDRSFALVGALSFGDESVTNPTGGTATWSGAMVGADIGSGSPTQGNPINGHAGITVDFANADVDVAFTNIVDLETGRARSDIRWTDIDMTRGAFQDLSGSIQGRFYGTNHEEVGGVFERDDIVGAFGARRD